MIKRLLILILVFGMVSTASAVTVGFRVDTPETVPGGYLPGDMITISLVADFEVEGFGISRITDDVPTSPVDLTGSYMPAGYGISLGYWSGFKTIIDPLPYIVNAGNILVDNPAGDAVGASTFGVMGPGSPCPPATPMLTFNYPITDDACLAGTTINIGLVGAYVVDTGQIVHTPVGCNIPVVPEPMTIVLLGLGGLFLRRRR